MEPFDPQREDPAPGFTVAEWQPANRIELAKPWRWPRFSYTHVSVLVLIVILVLWWRPSLLGEYESDELRRGLPMSAALFGGLSLIGIGFMLVGRWSARRWRAVFDWRIDRAAIQRVWRRLEFPLSAIDGVELRGWRHDGKPRNVSGEARHPDFFMFKVVLLLSDSAAGNRRAVALLEPRLSGESAFTTEVVAKWGTPFPELGDESLADDLRDPVRRFLRDKNQDPRNVLLVVRLRDRLDAFAAGLAGALDVPYVPLVDWQAHGVPRPE